MVVARELTKLHEEFLRGTASEVLAILRGRAAVKGEITLLVGKRAKPVADAEETIEAAVRRHEAAGMARMEAIKTVARERDLPKREVYKLFERD